MSGSIFRFVISENGEISPALNNIITFLFGEALENNCSADIIRSARFPLPFGCKELRAFNLEVKSFPRFSATEPFTQPMLSPSLNLYTSSIAALCDGAKPLRTSGDVKLVVPSKTNTIS